MNIEVNELLSTQRILLLKTALSALKIELELIELLISANRKQINISQELTEQINNLFHQLYSQINIGKAQIEQLINQTS